MSDKIRVLSQEGHPQPQAVAMALSMERAGRLRKGGKYIPATGAEWRGDRLRGSRSDCGQRDIVPVALHEWSWSVGEGAYIWASRHVGAAYRIVRTRPPRSLERASTFYVGYKENGGPWLFLPSINRALGGGYRTWRGATLAVRAHHQRRHRAE